MLATSCPGLADHLGQHKRQCFAFGFQPGTDGFANCLLQMTLKHGTTEPPDHSSLVEKYRDQSIRNRGDDRYPVCSASMMENELDITTGKWVGPQC